MNLRIIALCGPLEGQVFSLPESSDVYIGRGKNNQIRIDDPRLALRHCLIDTESGHCMLFAIDYERGTFVNEFSRPGKMLVHGDRIKLGVSIVLFIDREEFDPALLKLTEAEKHWYHAVCNPQAALYEPT